MKLRNLFEKIGLRKPTKKYGYEINSFKLDKIEAHYAHWLHPSEKKQALETEHVDAYKKIIQKGDFCLDIGAHSGDSTIPMALAAGSEGCVLALEPNPYVYHVLEKNIRLNRHSTHIKSIMAAASNHPGQSFTEFEYTRDFCNGGRHENIPFFRHGHPLTLQAFCINLEEELQNDFSEYLEKLKFIKIDTEGYDLNVIKSIKGIITKYRPIIKTEVFKHTDKAYRLSLLDFFNSLDYTISKIEKEPIITGEKINKSNVKKWKHYDILCMPNKKLPL